MLHLTVWCVKMNAFAQRFSMHCLLQMFGTITQPTYIILHMFNTTELLNLSVIRFLMHSDSLYNSLKFCSRYTLMQHYCGKILMKLVIIRMMAKMFFSHVLMAVHVLTSACVALVFVLLLLSIVSLHISMLVLHRRL